jgi:arsenite methyltransferase
MMDEKVIRPDEIRSAVRQRYGQIAREHSEPTGSCCGPSSSCCGSEEGGGSAAQALYQIADLADVPADISGMSLGCGDPVTLAALQPGQTVLDLGSGGGLDCFLAAKRVGPTGRVIGVDMTAEMIDRARAHARRLGATNVEFRLGEIEHLPVADESVDVIISNCVINLSADKQQVFREALRALRPGGVLAVTDIVTRAALPPEVVADRDAWSACVAGAWVDRDYVGALESAGFRDNSIAENGLDEATADEVMELGVEGDTAAMRKLIYSARVRAVKPA